MFDVSSLITLDREYRASVKAIAESFRAECLPVAVNGLSSAAADAYLVRLIKDIGAELKLASASVSLILTGSPEERERITSLLCSSGVRAASFKDREPVFHNVRASHDNDRERLSVLSAILGGRLDCVVSTASAALSLTMPRYALQDSSLSIETGDELPPATLCTKLVKLGFASVDAVEGRGQFSLRGGIIDFWCGESEAPIRVEFFGDEVDRMAYFDPISQRSVTPTDKVLLLPAREMIPDQACRDRIRSTIDKLLKSPTLSEQGRSKLLSEGETVAAGLPIDFIDKYMGLVYDTTECLLDYINDKGRGIVLLDGTSACLENAKKWVDNLDNSAKGMISTGLVTPRAAAYTKDLADYEGFLLTNQAVHLNPFAGGVGNMRLGGLFGFRSKRTVSYGGNISMLIEDLRAYVRGAYRMVILCENRAGVDSLADTLEAEGFVILRQPDPASMPAPAEMKTGVLYITVGRSDGFDLITPRVALISMAQDSGRAIMEKRRQKRILKQSGGETKRIMSYADLSPGDYVVHTNFGIGRFDGIEAVTVDGVTKDYITIQYAGTDKLFVPCDRLEMIGKYIGNRDKDGGVKLSRMGGVEWTRTKGRAKAAAKDIAKSLIALYAERQRLPGFAFPPPSEMEDEFDSEFEFEETDSQLLAISQIKDDMMKSVPMNRLLCGDVGFGKTEVALRAAFKAVLGGKQVALLVPTTILALQHYETALSRMRGYPVTVEMISRFRKPKEREAIIKRTERGEIDILIGTHSIISGSVKFKDLGLLIIDEEQRFGVAQKEKLRQMSRSVDTLMLSATPIPRTLNMAMSGISDISVLDEAPGERRPVQTYVLEHDNAIIYDAISKEIDRGGQVLYLYNKVEDIFLVADHISEALPKARVAYAHGQMDKDELEDIWQLLVRGEIDVLVCTTIIETGVDLPNANTLIIENADRFGLSQLHQIRGRVGRSERQAYAYLTYRPGRVLTEVAQKRLEAVREFAEFGAGFKIALRDLEIRGAGNILGAEQHGYIESVGYDLYLKLLNEAVLEESGRVAERPQECSVAISITAHIPERYISSSAGRMEMYKKIGLIETEADALSVTDELIDRYGDIPRETMRLINVALAKAIATAEGIKRIECKADRLSFHSEKPRLDIWAGVFEEFKALSFLGVSSPVVVYRLSPKEDPTAVAASVMKRYLASKNEGL